MGELSMRRIKIEITLLTMLLVCFLAFVVFVSEYECFKEVPTVFYRGCQLNFWTEKLAAVFALR